MYLVLLSGGMDSTACLLWAQHVAKPQKRNVRALFFDYGQAAKREEFAAASVIASTCRVRLDVIETALCGGIAGSQFDPVRPSQCVVPARNVVFLAIAAGLVHEQGGGSVVIGCCAADAEAFPDCRPRTLDALQTLLDLGGISARVEAPFIEADKATIAGFVASTAGISMLRASTSCYLGLDCGKCHACKARTAGIEEAGLA